MATTGCKTRLQAGGGPICAAFVLLVGRDGVQQRWVGAEVEVALSRKLSPHDDRERLPIFPVLLPEAALDELPVFLKQIQSLDWRPDAELPPGLRDALQARLTLHNAPSLPLLKGEPYRGLSYFRREDADRFFGRHRRSVKKPCTVWVLPNDAGNRRPTAGALPPLAANSRRQRCGQVVAGACRVAAKD
ncbi:MAG: hypothetical protein R3E89_03100 [Thiolinea sp.]